MSNALTIRQLRKTYANGFAALKGIDLDVAQGDFFALLGPNGAGKSTTIGVICSLVQKTGGTVEVFGTDIDANFPLAKRHLGVVPQEFNFNHFEKVGDILVTQAGYYGLPLALARERAQKYLHRLDLWDKRGEPARNLSGGMKRRLMIARAMMNEPRLLILDEPTAGVDIEIRRSMWKFISAINRAGTTVILTTHYLEEAEQLCRNVAIIDHGSIVEHTTIKRLIAKLDVETFVLDVAGAIPDALPEVAGVKLAKVDEHSLEAEMGRAHDLNSLFAALSTRGIVVTSMRNKANRLEELFVRLVDANRAA